MQYGYSFKSNSFFLFSNFFSGGVVYTFSFLLFQLIPKKLHQIVKEISFPSHASNQATFIYSLWTWKPSLLFESKFTVVSRSCNLKLNFKPSLDLFLSKHRIHFNLSFRRPWAYIYKFNDWVFSFEIQVLHFFQLFPALRATVLKFTMFVMVHFTIFLFIFRIIHWDPISIAISISIHNW